MKEVKIELIRGYFIEVDEMNHTLKQRYIGKKKDTNEEKECERLIGYYPSVKSCLERIVSLISLDICETEEVTMNEYIESQEKAIREVKELIEQLGGIK